MKNRAKEISNILFLNTPDYGKLINRDMAGGLGFDRSKTTILPPLEFLSYASVLEKKGFKVSILDAQVEFFTKDEILNIVNNFKPDIIVLTISLPSLEHDISFSNDIKINLNNKNCEIVLKTGIQDIFILKKILLESDCSFCITGEVDLIIDQVLFKNTYQGTIRILDGKCVKVKENLLRNMNKLPILNRKFLKNELYKYSNLGENTTTLQTSRGCPFSCYYYCPYPLVQGRKWRAMSAERIFKELKEVKQYTENIFFRDATFTLDKNRIINLCKLILSSTLQLSWWCETRVDCLDIELLTIMKNAGCKGINIGIETGDEQFIHKAKEGASIEKIVELTKYCKSIDIKLRFLLMLGLPGENYSTLANTFNLVYELKPSFIGITSVTPYPGTQFYDDSVEKGWIINSDINTFGGHGYNIEIPPLKSEDLKYAMNSINKLWRLQNSSEELLEDTIKLKKEFNEWAIAHQ